MARAGDLVIVIDDLGYNLDRAQRILNWPQPMTLGVLPYAPHSAKISARAAALGKEVILHQPMEPESSVHARAGLTHGERGMLELGMSAQRIDAQLNDALARVPQAVGVNNHTGSRLTANRTSMERLMPLIRIRGLFFLDSRTTPNTVAEATAREWHVPTLRRDVFLDHVLTAEALSVEFDRALQLTQARGRAVMIAHPHAITLDFLEERLDALPAGVRLTTLQALVDSDYGREIRPIGPAALARHENPAFLRRSLGR